MTVKEFFPEDFPIKVNPIEVENGDSIPTAILLQKLKEQYKESSEFSFIIGSDLIKGLHCWDDGTRLINEEKFIVYLRKGFPNDLVENHVNFPKNNPIVVAEEESLIGVISSTEIRKRIRISRKKEKPGYDIAGLVTPGVIKYIKDKRLYQEEELIAKVDLVVSDMKKRISGDPSATNSECPQLTNKHSHRHVLLHMTSEAEEKIEETSDNLNYAKSRGEILSPDDSAKATGG